MGSLPNPRAEHAAVTMKGIGNYLIGGRNSWSGKSDITSDYLAPNSSEWVSGPWTPAENVFELWGTCAVVISETSFLVIGGQNIREYKVESSDPTSNDGWQESWKWPHLQTKRSSMAGCAKISGMVVIAGGISPPASNSDFPHKSTEVLDLETKTIKYGQDLNTGRRGFHLLTITVEGMDRVWALGGTGGTDEEPAYPPLFDSIEEFDPTTSTWRVLEAKLAEGRAYFGAVLLPQNMICQC